MAQEPFYKTANFLSRIFFAPGGPGPYWGPGPEASALPASWMIRPWVHPALYPMVKPFAT